MIIAEKLTTELPGVFQHDILTIGNLSISEGDMGINIYHTCWPQAKFIVKAVSYIYAAL